MTHMRSHPLPETDPVAGGVSALRAGDPPRDEMSEGETGTGHISTFACGVAIPRPKCTKVGKSLGPRVVF